MKPAERSVHAGDPYTDINGPMFCEEARMSPTIAQLHSAFVEGDDRLPSETKAQRDQRTQTGTTPCGLDPRRPCPTMSRPQGTPKELNHGTNS